MILVAVLVSIVTLPAGVLLGALWSNRWIDHRWYCGRRHPASHRCAPTPEHLERWRRFEVQQDEAEKLENRARRLRGGTSWIGE